MGNGTLSFTHHTTVPPRLAAGGPPREQVGNLSHRTVSTLRERQTPPAAGDVHVTTFDADPTGKIDASAPIQAALQCAITSPCIVTGDLDGGTYLSLSSTVQHMLVKTDDENAPAPTTADTAPEKGRPLKLVVGISVLGIVGFVAIEAFECAHRVRRAGGLRAWWGHSPPHGQPDFARADQRKAD